jgi:hypothetical protein
MGCYSFANHVLAHHPGTPLGFEIPTVGDALRSRYPDARITLDEGSAVEGDDRSGIAAAVESARSSDVAIVVVGDRAGLFGRGTVGEGNDVESLELPGVQRELVEAVVATGTPVIVVVLSGRPYAIGWALDGESAAASVVQSFFPGEEGGTALAAVLAGDAEPSGRLPVSLPRSAGAQPYSYLHPILGGPNEVTSSDSTPVRPFGFGLGYTTFERTGLITEPTVPTDGRISASVRVRNSGQRVGIDLVQLYARDLVGSVTRPVAQLLGYARVELDPGEEAVVVFDVPTARLGFSNRDFVRVVEPGEIELWVGGSSAEKQTSASVLLTGDEYPFGADAPAITSVTVTRSVA